MSEMFDVRKQRMFLFTFITGASHRIIGPSDGSMFTAV